MKRAYSWLLALCLCLTLTQVAGAQGGGGQGRRGQGFGFGRGGFGGGGLQMLSIPEVQKELKMTQEQIDKAQAKQGEVREASMQVMQEAGGPQAFRDMSEEDRQKMMAKMQAIQQKAVDEVLTTDQKPRYRQLTLQQAGAQAFFRKDVAEELKITKEQSDKMREVQQEQGRAMREAMQGIDFQNMTDDERKQMQEKMQKSQKATFEKIVAVLSEDQQKQWKKMTGEPFKFPPMRGFGPGGGGGRRQRDA